MYHRQNALILFRSAVQFRAAGRRNERLWTNDEDNGICAQHKIIKLVLVILTPDELPVAADHDTLQLEGLGKMQDKLFVRSSVRHKHNYPVRRFSRRNCCYGLGWFCHSAQVPSLQILAPL